MDQDGDLNLNPDQINRILFRMLYQNGDEKHVAFHLMSLLQCHL